MTDSVLSTKRHLLLITTATALVTGLASETFAQHALTTQTAPAAPTTAKTPGDGIEEVIVTAQKRSQSLQKVPVSVQVISGKTLQAENYNNLQTLGQVLPAVHIVNNGDFANSLNIRGIGSGSGNPAFDQSVATFVDDIYFGRSREIQSTFLDEDRIEVLKGPQSTFFGNNAIAGALNIVTKKPDDHFDGYVRTLYGSYNAYATEGATSVPVSDTLSFRLAGTVNGQGGWIKNENTRKSEPQESDKDGRVTAVYKPSEDFTAVLKVEGGENKLLGSTSDIPGQFSNCPPPSPLGVNGINMFCSFALANKVPLGFHNNENSTLPGQFASLHTNQEILTLNYHQWGQTFTSVTGIYGYNYEANHDNANVGNQFVSTNTIAPENYEQFSQEFRIASPTGGTFEYLAGVYYQHDRTNEQLDGAAVYLNPMFPRFERAGLLTPTQLGELLPKLPLGFGVGYAQEENIESAFASLTWNVTKALKVTGGIRLTDDGKTFDGNIFYGQATQIYGGIVPYSSNLQQGLGFLLGPPGSYPYARTDRAVLPSGGVQYQITSAAMAYATYSRGFKAGGYNAISPSPVGGLVTPAFGPEFVNSYEVGIKSKWLDNRLLINFDLFQEDYSGLQVNSLIQLPANSTIAVENAASSVSQGAELEAQANVLDDLRLTANITYLDVHYTSFPKASPTFVQRQDRIASQNLVGEPLDFAPKWSGSITAAYKVHLPRDYDINFSVTPFYQSSYFDSNGTDDPNFRIPGRLRLDAQITFDSPVRNWAFDLIGKNLTNVTIPVSYGTNDTLGGKEEPINFAGQLRYKW